VSGPAIEVPRQLLEVLFDAAVGSMDFGSGMFDDEEVAALRSTAELLGVDPKLGTPVNFLCKYYGHERWTPELLAEYRVTDDRLADYLTSCRHCRLRLDWTSGSPVDICCPTCGRNRALYLSAERVGCVDPCHRIF
jgi:hypothetical protein